MAIYIVYIYIISLVTKASVYTKPRRSRLKQTYANTSPTYIVCMAAYTWGIICLVEFPLCLFFIQNTSVFTCCCICTCVSQLLPLLQPSRHCFTVLCAHRLDFAVGRLTQKQVTRSPCISLVRPRLYSDYKQQCRQGSTVGLETPSALNGRATCIQASDMPSYADAQSLIHRNHHKQSSPVVVNLLP